MSRGRTTLITKIPTVTRPLLALVAVAFLLVPIQLQAQDLIRPEKAYEGSIYYFAEVPNTLFMLGDVEAGTVIDFRRAIRNHDVEKLVLVSPGGRVSGGLELASIVNDKGISTYIPADADCASACSFIFFGGKDRVAKGRIGIHQISTKADLKVDIQDSYTYVQQSIGDIIAILNEFETPNFVYEHMFSTQADQMYWLDSGEYAQVKRGADQDWHSEVETFLVALGESMERVAEMTQSEPETSHPTPKKETIQPSSQPTPVQSPTPSAPRFSKDQVARLQRALNRHNCGAGVADGLAGPRTERALERFLVAAKISDTQFATYTIETLSARIERTPRPACAPDKTAPKTQLSSDSLPPMDLAASWAVLEKCSNQKGFTTLTGDASVTAPAPQYKTDQRYNSVKYVVRYRTGEGRYMGTAVESRNGVVVVTLGRIQGAKFPATLNYTFSVSADRNTLTAFKNGCEAKAFRVVQ